MWQETRQREGQRSGAVTVCLTDFSSLESSGVQTVAAAAAAERLVAESGEQISHIESDSKLACSQKTCRIFSVRIWFSNKPRNR